MTNSSNLLHGYHIINPTASLLNFDQIMKMMNRLGVESVPFITNTKRVCLYLRNPRQTHSTYFASGDYIYICGKSKQNMVVGCGLCSGE